MVDLALLAGRLLLLAMLYLFLFAAIRVGVRNVSVAKAARQPGGLVLKVVEGPPELRGVALPITAPVVIGRSPGADIVIGDTFVSGRHARVAPVGHDVIIEDLGSTNGTLLNGSAVDRPQSLRPGDVVDIGAVRLTVDAS